MADQKASNAVFAGSGNREQMSVVITSAGGSGTAQLQKLAGNDPAGTWVNVTDGLYTGDSEFTFYAPAGQKFRITLTGDAVAYVAG